MIFESSIITGIYLLYNIEAVNVANVPNRPGYAAKIMKYFQHCVLDIVIQTTSEDNKKAEMFFTISNCKITKGKRQLKDKMPKLKVRSIRNLAKLDIEGYGALEGRGFLTQVYSILSCLHINIYAQTTSGYKFTFVVDSKELEANEEELRSRLQEYGFLKTG